MNVVCRSLDAYTRLPVEKYELVNAPGLAFTTRAAAARTAGLFATSTVGEWKTTTFGGRTPTPKALNVRWLASYAGFPGIARLWYHLVDSFPAATPPSNVSTIHTTITGQRWRAVKRPSRA